MSPSPKPRNIFISYKNNEEEALTAAKLYQAFQEEGFSVWWAPELQCGKAWADELDKAIRDAHCIVVLWSTESVESRWVCHEASQAISRQVYAPCRIDLVELKSPYDRLHISDLINWNGDRQHGGFRKLIERVEELIPAPVSLPYRIKRWLSDNRNTLLASTIALAALGLLGTIYKAQRNDREGKIYDCSTSKELRVEIVKEMYAENKDELQDVCLKRVKFFEANLSGANLDESNLTKAKLFGANLNDTTLIQAKLIKADLTNATLCGANLNKANLKGANFSQATLRKAFFSETNLIGTDFTGADLSEASFYRHKLTGADFSGANLSGADFTGAILKNADFSRACANPKPIGWPKDYEQLPACKNQLERECR